MHICIWILSKMHIKNFIFFFEKSWRICLYTCVLEILWKKIWKKKLFLYAYVHMHIFVDKKVDFFWNFFWESSIRWFLRCLVVVILKNLIICTWIEKICIWKKKVKLFAPVFFLLGVYDSKGKIEIIFESFNMISARK